MTLTWMKFLSKLDKNIRLKLEKVIENILNNDFDNLDIQPLIWKKWYFKVRVWKIRVIFTKSKDENIIDKIDYRWDVYKNL